MELGIKHSLTLDQNFSERFMEYLIKQLNFQKTKDDQKHPTLFSLKKVDKDDSTKDPEILKSMQLVRIDIKCKECDFELRIGKNNIDKCFRQGKPFSFRSAKEHRDIKKHEIIVQQTFKKYTSLKLKKLNRI